jgi:hypothetical protein
MAMQMSRIIDPFITNFATKEDIGDSWVPYQFENLPYLNNSFQGGIFDEIHHLLMTDTLPLEYKSSLKIFN